MPESSKGKKSSGSKRKDHGSSSSSKRSGRSGHNKHASDDHGTSHRRCPATGKDVIQGQVEQGQPQTSCSGCFTEFGYAVAWGSLCGTCLSWVDSGGASEIQERSWGTAEGKRPPDSSSRYLVPREESLEYANPNRKPDPEWHPKDDGHPLFPPTQFVAKDLAAEAARSQASSRMHDVTPPWGGDVERDYQDVHGLASGDVSLLQQMNTEPTANLADTLRNIAAAPGQLVPPPTYTRDSYDAVFGDRGYHAYDETDELADLGQRFGNM